MPGRGGKATGTVPMRSFHEAHCAWAKAIGLRRRARSSRESRTCGVICSARHRHESRTTSGISMPNCATRCCKAVLGRLTERTHIIETGPESYRFHRTFGKKRKGLPWRSHGSALLPPRPEGHAPPEPNTTLLNTTLQRVKRIKRPKWAGATYQMQASSFDAPPVY